MNKRKLRLKKYCLENGAKAVWQSWRDNMIEQERDIKQEYMDWETLPDRDKSLDANIAYAVLANYIMWEAFNDE